MNPNQLATEAEAKVIAEKLGNLGGGVKDTYIPEYDGPWGVPSMGDNKFFHFRFQVGAEGFNVGLIRTLAKQCPTTWLNIMAIEIDNQVKSMREMNA